MRQFFVFIFSLVFSVTLIAGEVNLPHTFQPNTKAKANEVNANFNAVKDAVNDNNSRIRTLENTTSDHSARIQSLENTTADHSTRIQNLESKKILSVTYPSICFNVVMDPTRSLPYHGEEVSDSYVVLMDVNGAVDNQSLFCPITLPEGSKILRIIARVHDETPFGSITLHFVHFFPTPSSHASETHLIGTTDDSGAQQFILDLSSVPEVIERGVPYKIKAYFSNDTLGFDLHIDQIIVIYEYDPTYSGTAP